MRCGAYAHGWARKPLHKQKYLYPAPSLVYMFPVLHVHVYLLNVAWSELTISGKPIDPYLNFVSTGVLYVNQPNSCSLSITG